MIWKRNNILIALVFLLASCQSYKQNIMFRTDLPSSPRDVEQSKKTAEKNYRIQINDRLEVSVFTNEGERIIDPDYKLRSQNPQQNFQEEAKTYIVQKDGSIKVPMIGMIQVKDMTLLEAEEMIGDLFSAYYKDPFVEVKFVNKRVIVLGAPGGKVIPLENEDMNLIEILALAGGLDNYSKAHNIRLIRGDLSDPEVQLIDLSTIEGLKQAELKVYSGDIIYVEPVRKIVSESITDIAPLLSLLISTLTLIVLIQSL